MNKEFNHKKLRKLVIIFSTIIILIGTSFVSVLSTDGFKHLKYISDFLPQVFLSYVDYDGEQNTISLNVSGYSLEKNDDSGDGNGRESTEDFAALRQTPGPKKILTDKAELSFKITNTREPEEIYILSWPETVLEDLERDLKSSGIPVPFEAKYKELTHTLEGKINISSDNIYGIRLVWGEDWLDYNFQVK